jgi:hypothetical protein
MRAVGLARWVAMCVLLPVASLAATATTLRLEFGEVNGTLSEGPQFGTLTAARTSPPVTIPVDERVSSAKISGNWGTIDYPDSTAPVDVFLDDVLVAQCLASNPCWKDDNSGQLAWSHTLTPAELSRIDTVNPQLTAVQRERGTVRLGLSTLVMETVPAPQIPTLSPFGLLMLLAATAAAGAFALRRFPRG